MDKICIVEGCPNKNHSKGYCRKHYGQLWRRGKITVGVEPVVYHKISEAMMCTLQNELESLNACYSNTVGFEGRIRWRRRINEVQTLLEKARAESNVHKIEAHANSA
jgi:hypothetical protein